MECMNWIVIENFHERYSFETNMRLHINTSLKDIFKEYGVDPDSDKIKKNNNIYTIDYSKHTKIDTKYSNPDLVRLPLAAINLDSLLICSLDDFYEEQYASFIWGDTNSKFGLIDLEKEGTII